MRRFLFLALALLALLALRTRTAAASTPHDPGTPKYAASARYICVPAVVWQDRALCPSHGPGTTAYRIAAINLPDALPELPVQELPEEDDGRVLPRTYAHVNTLPLNVYRHPMEAGEGLNPVTGGSASRDPSILRDRSGIR